MNVLLLVDSVRPPMTGIGRYVYELGRRLPQIKGVEQTFYYDLADGVVEPHELDARAVAPAPRSRLRANVTRTAGRIAGDLFRKYGVTPPGRPQLRVPTAANLVSHGPAFVLPPGDGPRVVTVADLSVLEFQPMHPKARIARIIRELKRTLRYADRLLTFSEFTRQELITRCNCDPARVDAVPLGADASFKPRKAPELVEPLARYGLAPGGYCLSVGTIEPRKQIDVTLDAFEKLDPALCRQFPLVLIGDRGWLSEQTHKRIAAMIERGHARYLGFVPQADLPFLYSGAKVCLYTSIYEGFGLPALEAMASGVPLIVTRAASLPEVCEDGADIVPSFGGELLVEGIEQVLTDESHATIRARLALARSNQFSWERTARETVAVYRKALGG